MSELDQTGRPTQAQHLHEQVRQGHEVALAEVGNGSEVRLVQPGHRHDVDPLLASRLIFGTVNSMTEWLRGDVDVDHLADTVATLAFDGLLRRED